jgi:hypothetical protein
MEKSKKCSGCKQEKSLTNFYKNRLVLDGHSNYCVDCTRENSKRYFQRKKEKIAKSENDNLIKMVMLNNYTSETDSQNAENLMKILIILRRTSPNPKSCRLCNFPSYLVNKWYLLYIYSYELN